MRELTRAEVVAMWLWDCAYSRQAKSAIDWCASLSPHRRGNVEDFITQYEAAREHELSARPASPPPKRDDDNG